MRSVLKQITIFMLMGALLQCLPERKTDILPAELDLLRVLNGPESEAIESLPVSGAVLWLRADAGISGSGSLVSQWRDQSGLGNHAVQASTTEAAHNSAAINGKAAVRFSNQLMSTPALSLGTHSVFLVTRGYNTNATVIEQSTNVTANDGFQIGSGTVCAIHIRKQAGATINAKENSTNSTYLQDGIFRILSSTFDGTNAGNLFYLNSQQQSLNPGAAPCNQSGTPLTGTTTDVLYLGGRANDATNRFQGDIAELVIYGSSLSSSDREKVECYLSRRYAISVSATCS